MIIYITEVQIKESSYPLNMLVFSLLIEWFTENIFLSTSQTLATRIFIRQLNISQSKMSSFTPCLSIWFQTILSTNSSTNVCLCHLFIVICISFKFNLISPINYDVQNVWKKQLCRACTDDLSRVSCNKVSVSYLLILLLIFNTNESTDKQMTLLLFHICVIPIHVTHWLVILCSSMF